MQRAPHWHYYALVCPLRALVPPYSDAEGRTIDDIRTSWDEQIEARAREKGLEVMPPRRIQWFAKEMARQLANTPWRKLPLSTRRMFAQHNVQHERWPYIFSTQAEAQSAANCEWKVRGTKVDTVPLSVKVNMAETCAGGCGFKLQAIARQRGALELLGAGNRLSTARKPSRTTAKPSAGNRLLHIKNRPIDGGMSGGMRDRTQRSLGKSFLDILRGK